MRQRVMIAMAVANDPDVLIADEPTTALDVTVQAQILDLLAIAASSTGLALVLITHDLGVVAGLADRVHSCTPAASSSPGRSSTLFHRPQHPYTRGLLASLPRLDLPDRELTPIGGIPPTAATTNLSAARSLPAVRTPSQHVPMPSQRCSLCNESLVACGVLPLAETPTEASR